MSDVRRYAPLLVAALLAACAQEPEPVELGPIPPVESQPEPSFHWESIPKPAEGTHLLGVVEPGFGHVLEPNFVCRSREPEAIGIGLPVLSTQTGPARYRFWINGGVASGWIVAGPHRYTESYGAELSPDEADRLLLALRGARTAELEEGGERHPVPLEDARGAIDAFRAACGLGYSRS